MSPLVASRWNWHRRSAQWGIQVVHVVIDGVNDGTGVRERLLERDPETFLDPDELAHTDCHLLEQDEPSTQPFEVQVTNGSQHSAFV